MKRMLCLLMILCLLPCAGLAENRWLIPDSDQRLLTQQELYGWDWESLEYVLKEIYARHGYHFAKGSPYGEYFAAQEWYQPHPLGNVQGCYAEMNDVEWQNVDLIRSVLMQLQADGNLNTENGRSMWSTDPIITPIHFAEVYFPGGQKYPVYSAPSTKAWRGGSGKAAVSTNGPVWAAGWEGEWLLVYYETSKGSVRVGYITGDSIPADLSVQNQLVFAQTPARITEKCTLTDDIARNAVQVASLKQGAEVTYLAPCYDNGEWAYIETRTEKKTVRGFVPMDVLEMIEE